MVVASFNEEVLIAEMAHWNASKVTPVTIPIQSALNGNHTHSIFDDKDMMKYVFDVLAADQVKDLQISDFIVNLARLYDQYAGSDAVQDLSRFIQLAKRNVAVDSNADKTVSRKNTLEECGVRVHVFGMPSLTKIKR